MKFYAKKYLLYIKRYDYCMKNNQDENNNKV